MSELRVAIFAGAFAICAAPALAQEDSQARGASPEDLVLWASKIQQDYPVAALRNAEQGTVTMRITVGTDGRVANCEVTQSSNSAALDEAACRGMTEHAIYKPALDEAGQPTVDTMSQSVRYVLPVGTKMKHFSAPFPIDEAKWREKVFDEAFVAAIEKSETKRALYVLTVDEEGLPTGCGMLWPSGDAELDRNACQRLLENAKFIPAELRRGQPVPGAYPVPYPTFEAMETSF